MSRLEDLWAVTSKLSTQDLLQFLLRERFSGKAVVTASLRARSVAVLKMISDVDPSTPVLFCHAAQLYPESLEYRAKLIELFGLTDVRNVDSHEASLNQCQPLPRDRDHIERLWVDDLARGGKVFELVHLNESLAEFDCWISAVYNSDQKQGLRHRVDADGRLIRVNPLLHWSDDDVRRFMLANEIPYHPRVADFAIEQPTEPHDTSPIYSY